MSTPANGDNAFITEFNQMDEDSDVQDMDSDASGEQESSNQIFNIREAVPPTDFDAPYSKMPKSVW